jgi:hypothetical protein
MVLKVMETAMFLNGSTASLNYAFFLIEKGASCSFNTIKQREKVRCPGKLRSIGDTPMNKTPRNFLTTVFGLWREIAEQTVSWSRCAVKRSVVPAGESPAPVKVVPAG